MTNQIRKCLFQKIVTLNVHFLFMYSVISNNLPKTKMLFRLKSRNGRYYINQILSHSSEYPLAENANMRHEWNWFVLGNKFLAELGCVIRGCARHKRNDVLVLLGPAFSSTYASGSQGNFRYYVKTIETLMLYVNN